jgi:hypothetical protein
MALRLRPPSGSRPILVVLGAAYVPENINGANVALDALCKRMVRAGLEPIVVCAAETSGASRPAGAAPEYGYTVLKLPDPFEAMKEMIARLEPASVVVRAPGVAGPAAHWAAASGRRLHIYFESQFFGQTFPSPSAAPDLRYAANSKFLARLASAYLGAPVATIPPLVEHARYRCRTTGEAVLFVNPVAVKGAHIAAAVAARLPHRKFVFVRAWPDHPSHPHAHVDLPNVEWADNSADMRPHYARARLVLVPSVWEESFGRVVVEAQASGIPAIVSDRGGLPETVGGGGVVVPLAAPIERWCAAVERMFTDKRAFDRLSRRARAEARRPELAPSRIAARFLEFVRS